MFDWFWDLGLMVTLQAFVDSVRTAMPRATLTIPLAVLAILGVLAWTQRAGRRDGQLPGHHFKGDLTPKTLTKLMVNSRVEKPKSRDEHQTALRGAKRRDKK